MLSISLKMRSKLLIWLTKICIIWFLFFFFPSDSTLILPPHQRIHLSFPPHDFSQFQELSIVFLYYRTSILTLFLLLFSVYSTALNLKQFSLGNHFLILSTHKPGSSVPIIHHHSTFRFFLILGITLCYVLPGYFLVSLSGFWNLKAYRLLSFISEKLASNPATGLEQILKNIYLIKVISHSHVLWHHDSRKKQIS